MHRFELDIDGGDVGDVAGCCGEEVGCEQQFVLGEQVAAEPLADRRGGRLGGVGAGDGGAEGRLQGQVADVAEEECPAGGQQLQCCGEDVEQVGGAGEVLDDGVEDDDVEVVVG